MVVMRNGLAPHARNALKESVEALDVRTQSHNRQLFIATAVVLSCSILIAFFIRLISGWSAAAGGLLALGIGGALYLVLRRSSSVVSRIKDKFGHGPVTLSNEYLLPSEQRLLGELPEKALASVNEWLESESSDGHCPEPLHRHDRHHGPG